MKKICYNRVFSASTFSKLVSKMSNTVPLKHFSHCLCFVTWLVFFNYSASVGIQLLGLSEAVIAYGAIVTILVVLVKLLR